MSQLGTHVRLCLKDLYAQDVVEMIERETRKYEVEAIEHPDHPDYARAFRVLWDAFGASGEMESEPVIRRMLLADQATPLASGTFARYFLLVARDRETGAIRGVRDGRVLACGNTSDVLTSTTVRQLYDVEADVRVHELAGHLTVVPLGRIR